MIDNFDVDYDSQDNFAAVSVNECSHDASRCSYPWITVTQHLALQLELLAQGHPCRGNVQLVIKLLKASAHTY